MQFVIAVLVKFVAIAGYNNFNCVYPKSIRIYSIDVTHGNALVPVDIINQDGSPADNPSDYVYAVKKGCYTFEGVSYPSFVFAGCPDSLGNVLWAYQYDPALSAFVKIGAWGANETPQPTTIYGLGINELDPACVINGYIEAQMAVVGKVANGVVNVYIISFLPFSLTTQSVIQLQCTSKSCDQFAVSWLPRTTPTNNCSCNIPCSILTIGGYCTTGDDCKVGNIHNWAVDCNGIATEVVSSTSTPYIDGGVIKFGGSCDYTVRSLSWAWTCCDKYPYPFLLATGDKSIPGGTIAKAIVYYFNPLTGVFSELAVSPDISGKLFTGKFTPGCDCKSVTVAGKTGECTTLPTPCQTNILNLKYDCSPTGDYPVAMNIIATTSFRDVVTSLAFCEELDANGNRLCDSMIVGTEASNYAALSLDPLCPSSSLDEIGVYKVYFCKPTNTTCKPVAICNRLPVEPVPCRSR